MTHINNRLRSKKPGDLEHDSFVIYMSLGCLQVVSFLELSLLVPYRKKYVMSHISVLLALRTSTSRTNSGFCRHPRLSVYIVRGKYCFRFV